MATGLMSESFKRLHTILDDVDNVTLVNNLIKEGLKEFNHKTLLITIPFSVIVHISFMINSYVDVDKSIVDLYFNELEHKNHQKKMLILNSLFKKNLFKNVKVERHLLTEYYLILCEILNKTKEKFNETLLEYMEYVENNDNEAKYLLAANFSKHLNEETNRIIYYNEQTYSKPVYSRIIYKTDNKDENENEDKLFLWMTEEKK